MEKLKDTPFIEIHKKLNAKLVPFAGYNMPVQYSEGVIAEHLIVRESVGVFDVSHMGEFLIEGEKALSLIQKSTTNDAEKLIDGKIQYSCMPNNTGGIVDDLLVYCIKHNQKYMLVVNASNIEKDWNWLCAINKNIGAKMTNISDKTALLAVQGPKSIEALQSLTKIDLSKIPYYSFVIDDFAGVKDVIISATGYTGAGGFELYFPSTESIKMWDSIFKAGEKYSIKPIGLGARDTLRLEKAFCLYGNDIDDTTSPIEAGLSWITKFTKDFTNSDNIKQQKEKGVSKKLVCFQMIDKGIPRHDYDILDESGKKIGRVTSGTMSPSLKKPIGMGYVTTEFSSQGSVVFIDIKGKVLKAEVVSKFL